MINFLIFLLNIVGTLFLSVEAIKLENFQKLAIILKKYNSILNPRIIWVDELGNRIDGKKTEDEDEPNGVPFFKMILSFFPLSLLISYLSLNKWVENYAILIIAIVGSFVVWTLTIILFEGMILFFKFLEKRLAKGIVGIIGFLMLFSSFVFQYYLASK